MMSCSHLWMKPFATYYLQIDISLFFGDSFCYGSGVAHRFTTAINKINENINKNKDNKI